MTIWRPWAPIEQPDLAPATLQPDLTHIAGEQTDITNSLQIFIFEKNTSPAQWRAAAITLDEEERKADLAAKRPILPPPVWQ